MLIVLHCECGEIYRAEERHIGGRIKCRKCDRTILIVKPNPVHPLPTQPATAPPVYSRQSVSASFRKRLAVIGILGILAIVIGAIIFNRSHSSNTESEQSTTARSSPSVSTTPSSVSPSSLPSNVSNPSPDSSSQPDRPPVSLANGTDIIQPRGSKGRGTLKISNGTRYDAVVRLADSVNKKTRRLVYVKANSDFTIGDIGPGNCILQFTTGTDWDKTQRKFLRDQSYSQFESLLEFRETKTDYGIEWAKFEVTLNPVLYGNARTSSINASDFEDHEIDERH
jgi:hypothetical protein